MIDEVYGPESAVCLAFVDAADAVWRLLGQMQAQANEDCPGRRTDEFYR